MQTQQDKIMSLGHHEATLVICTTAYMMRDSAWQIK